MAGDKKLVPDRKLVKVYVEKIVEWEIFLAVDPDADVEEVALDLINNDAVEPSNEGDPIFKSQGAPTKEEMENQIFLEEGGSEMAVVDHYTMSYGVRGSVREHVSIR